MDGDALPMSADPLAAVARSTGTEPVYRIADQRDGGLFAAKWKLEDASLTTGGVEEGILVFRTSGSATVTRQAGGGTVRKRPAIGSASFVAPDSRVAWTARCPFATRPRPAMRLQCLQNAALRSFASRIDGSSPSWIPGCRATCGSVSEFEIFAGAAAAGFALLAHTEDVLLRHLLRWHSSGQRSLDALAPRHPGTRSVDIMRRADYIDAHIGEDISLAARPTPACMSPGHFCAAFA
jgi:hypothetical protein